GPSSGTGGRNEFGKVPRMGTRFAGSQRLGDRRRRRLAVETDEVPENAGRVDSLPAPAGGARVVDGTHADSTSRDSSPAFSLPIAVIIPREWWNYLLGAMACVSLGSGLLVAGWCAPDWSASLGPGIGRLFAFPGAPAAKWFS